ncbi:MAG: hypothetical protein M1118_15380 [Chloroflexi bacterium]|nr:hypothetical protein [Chloroflexota bacterium]
MNGAIERKLNGGTTLHPLIPELKDAVVTNERAAAALSSIGLHLPTGTSRYQAVHRYVQWAAAAYQTTADAWSVLEIVAQSTSPHLALYQSLAQLATQQLHRSAVARQNALVALGLAPEGDVSGN